MWATSCRTVVSGISRRSVRIAYYGLFALSLIVSWILRKVAAPLMEKIPGINSFHTTLSREWFETDAVLQVSLGNFLFFTILAILMIGVKSQKDPRDGVHHGGWMMKSFVGASWLYCCWILCIVGMISGLDMMSSCG
ncbi:probable serine incorporator isoform X4 [Solanum tuberosum]|nr:PREDICTED: probable serine incorporator isoform X4 [Solanum tuberosum]